MIIQDDSHTGIFDRFTPPRKFLKKLIKAKPYLALNDCLTRYMDDDLLKLAVDSLEIKDYIPGFFKPSVFKSINGELLDKIIRKFYLVMNKIEITSLFCLCKDDPDVIYDNLPSEIKLALELKC